MYVTTLGVANAVILITTNKAGAKSIAHSKM